MVYYIHQRGEFCICDFVYAQTHHHREDNEGVCVRVCVGFIIPMRCVQKYTDLLLVVCLCVGCPLSSVYIS